MLSSDLNCSFEQAILLYVSSVVKKSDVDFNLKECLSLARSARIKIIDTLISNRADFNAKYCVGIGKVLELEKKVRNSSVSVVICSCSLSSRQERNLMCLLECKVIDRNQLILNIFAQRAQTYEGKLQVKLAQLRYFNSRLTHEWNHLERQKGGIGLRGGPGEMQLENDRRILRKQIVRILSRLNKIEHQREQSRSKRFRMGMPTVSLIGYTNAGKSTLFNLMTASHVYTAEKLFATLDPTFRRIVYKGPSRIILVDTVGFIQDLPSDLISAFKTTLKETMESTLLLHVVDVSSQKLEKNIDVVNSILNDIRINNLPMILVMNKIDKFEKEISPRIDRNHNGDPVRVWISAHKRLGISLLIQVLNELLSKDIVNYELRMPINHDLCQKLYQLQVVQKYWMEDNYHVRLKVHLSLVDWNRLLKKNKSLTDYVI